MTSSSLSGYCITVCARRNKLRRGGRRAHTTLDPRQRNRRNRHLLAPRRDCVPQGLSGTRNRGTRGGAEHGTQEHRGEWNTEHGNEGSGTRNTAHRQISRARDFRRSGK
eukprot:6441712-Prymnesium_polylepis.1